MDVIISMEDMAAVYEVSDDLGIDRESINVELAKEDPGGWRKGDGGMMKREVFRDHPAAVDVARRVPAEAQRRARGPTGVVAGLPSAAPVRSPVLRWRSKTTRQGDVR